MEQTSEAMAWMGRQDGSVIIGHGPFTDLNAPPAAGVAFYVQDFALRSSAPWKIPARVEKIPTAEFHARFFADPAIHYEWQPLDAVPFSVVFQEIMTAIRSGIFEKTVPVIVEKGRCPSNPGSTLAAAMTHQGPPLHTYGWIHGRNGFAGATPELLFTLQGKSLTTMALAGTARSEDRDVFEVDEKEIREHEYVAQTLVAKLLDYGNLTRKSREILELGSIVHFLTLIQVELHASHSPEELIKRLHPTPALGPLPRTDVTLGMLLKWRKRLGCPDQFGAPFGLWDDGTFQAIVAIRGIWWEDEQIQLPAGCGIIEASRLVNEWRELRLKREAVKQFLKVP